MRERYNIMLDPDRVKEIDEIRGLISRSSYLNELIGDEIKRVKGDKQTVDENIEVADQQVMDKEEIEKIPEVTNQQVIQIEIERLVTSLKHHHRSLSEIRMFMKNSLVMINKDNTTRGIQSLTLDELIEIVTKEAEAQGIHCVE